ncbi:MAG: MBL fold metallo-hydrolase [Flavobacteriales bacterium]|nr:MBL fold metallo-hydrolase [Flavobacteriales bacterium]MCB9167399.1 MBL fold metallo-hydrolase [Flavobacteriales bacterium]
MLRVARFTFNPFQENTYVVHNGREAIVVDPGCWNASEEHELEQYLTEQGLTLVRCLNTHAHVDHVFGNAWVQRRFGPTPELHPDDLELLLGAPQQALLYGLHCDPSPMPERFLHAGDVIELGEDRLEVLHVPGHSPGHVAFLCQAAGCILSGDVLFQRSIGRTDLPGGNYAQLLSSIRESLMTLSDDVIVHSGHGPDTTIGAERRANPFLRELSASGGR